MAGTRTVETTTEWSLSILEWGVIAIVILLVWRWVNALLRNRGGNSIQSSDYYQPGYPQQPYGVVPMYGSPVGWGPYDGRTWNDPGNFGGWYNGGDFYGSYTGHGVSISGDYPFAWGRPVTGDPGGSKRW